MQNVCGTAEGRLGIDDPVLTEQGTDQGSEQLGIPERLVVSVKSEFPLPEGPLEAGHKLAPKHAAENLPRQKERIVGLNPARVIGGQTTRRNHAVDMRMMLQVLSPGVEHAQEANLSAEVMGIGGDFQQRRGAGAEQQAIEDALVLLGERRQLVRQREDHVTVTNGQ